MLVCGWLGEIVYFLSPRQKILPVFFVGILFVSFYKTAESVTQQIRNCPCKTKTATTGMRPRHHCACDVARLNAVNIPILTLCHGHRMTSNDIIINHGSLQPDLTSATS